MNKLIIFLIFIYSGQTWSISRGPAIEPVTSIALDENQPELKPEKEHYYDFGKNPGTISKKEAQPPFHSKKEYLEGKVAGENPQSLNIIGDTVAYTILCMMLLLPLALRTFMYIMYRKRTDQQLSTSEVATVEDAEVIPFTGKDKREEKEEEHKKAS